MVTVVDMDRSGDGTAPRRRRLPAAERRETILLGAAEVFAQAGYRAAKVSDVAARVGVSEPVIFQNFGSKAALFAAVVERAAAEVSASLDDLAAGFGSPSGLLAHVLTGGAHGHPARPRPTPEPGTQHGAHRCRLRRAVRRRGHHGRRAGADRAGPRCHPRGRHSPGRPGPARPSRRRHPTRRRPRAAAWLLLSVLSARRLRAAAMPAGLEPAITALALDALASPAAAAPGRNHAPPEAPGHPDTGKH